MEELKRILSRCCRSHCWVRNADGHPGHRQEPLDDSKVRAHLAGLKRYGVCPMAPGESTTRLALYDLDAHQGETSPEDMVLAAIEIIDRAKLMGLEAIPFRSSGGNGYHLYFMWDEPQDARSVRIALTAVLESCGFKNGTGGVAKGEVEIFPKSDSVPKDGWGSMVWLPFSGKSCALELVELESMQ